MSAARRVTKARAGRGGIRPSRFRRRIEVPTIHRIAEAGEALDAWAGRARVPDERRRELMLAYDELASNVANHARHATELRLEARRLRSGAVVLVVEDDGAPFDPFRRRRPRTDQPLEEREVGGLGIFLVRDLATSVEYELRGGRNRIRVELAP